MPRNSSGTYTLPTGNPITTRTLIESSWANSTLGDIANEITGSLARNGAGGMTGPLKATDGGVTAPSITFGLETSTGLYRVSAGQIGMTTLGVQRFTISGSGATFSVPVTVSSNMTVSGVISGNGSGLTSLNASNISGTIADAQLSSNVALKNAANTFTANQLISASGGIGLTVNGVAGIYAADMTSPADGSNNAYPLRARGSSIGAVYATIENTSATGTANLWVAANNFAARIKLTCSPTFGAIGTETNHQLSLRTNDTDRLTISTGGNITINAPTSGSHTVNGNVILSAGASSIFTINSSGSTQLRLENTAASANNKNWIVYADTASLQIRPYTDDYVSSTAALSISRSGVTAGSVQTYGNVNVGANQSGIGQLGVVTGTNGRSGFVAFFNPSGGREGYIGFSPTTGGGDAGTIEYIAGRHDFAGRANTRPISVSFGATPTFDSSLSNTILFGTMTANVTSMTISNPVDGAQLQIRFVQDATGGRTVTLPSNVQVSGALNTAANAVTWLVLTYVSSASRWEGTWTRVN
jgi:hypothetical protein